MSLYLVRQHVRFELSGGEEQSGLCKFAMQVSEKLDCSKVEASIFSNVYGVPTASFGVLFFLAFLLHLLIGRPRPRVEGEEDSPLTDPFWCVVALYSAAGLAVSILLAAISGFLIGGFCSGCTIVYLISLVNVALAIRVSVVEYIAMAISGFPALWTGFVRAFGDERAAGTEWTRRATLLFVFAAAPAALGLPAIYVARSRTAQAIKAYQAQRVVIFRHNELMIDDGPENAPLEIVVFADFMCPACQEFQPKLKKLLEGFPRDRYRIIYKLFPMEKECNPIMEKLQGEHKGACDLAAMGQALDKHGKFWEFYGDLYKAKHTALYDSLKAISLKAGIEYIDWVTLAKSDANRKQVGSDIFEGVAVKMTSLPSVFINGRFVSTLKTDSLEAIIRYELDAVAKGKSAPPTGEPPAKPEAAAKPEAPPSPAPTPAPSPAPSPARAPSVGGPPSTLEP